MKIRVRISLPPKLSNHCFTTINLVIKERQGFPGGSVIRNPQVNARDMGSVPGWGRSLEKEMVTHFSILAWETPWTEEPGGLQS